MNLKKNETRMFWPIIGLAVYLAYIIVDQDLNARNRTEQEILISKVESADRVERMMAVRKLGQIRPATQEVRLALVNALLDEDKAVRMQAACQLETIGPIASEAVKALKFMTRETDPDIKAAAEKALIKIEQPLSASLQVPKTNSPPSI